jgi:hypothetical protein
MRDMTVADLPWLNKVCIARYPKRFDAHTTSAWFKNLVLSNPLQFLAIRSDHAFVVAHLEAMPWTAFELEVSVMFTCCEEGVRSGVWEALNLLKQSMEWGRQRKAVRWHLWSDTSFDLGPFAQRLGCEQASSRYIKTL